MTSKEQVVTPKSVIKIVVAHLKQRAGSIDGAWEAAHACERLWLRHAIEENGDKCFGSTPEQMTTLLKKYES